MRTPDASKLDPTASLPSAAAPARATEDNPAAESVQDEVNVGSLAHAASSLDAGDSRIAELRQQVADQTYRVDSNRLSSAIIDEHLQK